MKNILICIQQRLEAQVPALKHIDRNWGQLNIPQPPVKFPCCLVDIDAIDYSQASGGCRLATAQISLTVADQHTVRSSAKAPARDDAFAILAILGDVIDALDGYSVPLTTQPLTRTRLQKSFSDQSYDVYSLIFDTAWIEPSHNEGETATASPSLSVRILRGSE